MFVKEEEWPAIEWIHAASCGPANTTEYTSRAMNSSSSVALHGDEARMKARNVATDIQGGGEMVVGGGDEPLMMQVSSSKPGAARKVYIAGRRRGGRHQGCPLTHNGAKWPLSHLWGGHIGDLANVNRVKALGFFRSLFLAGALWLFLAPKKKADGYASSRYRPHLEIFSSQKLRFNCNLEIKHQ